MLANSIKPEFACHPRLACWEIAKAWMPATSAGMTVVNRCVHSPKLHLPRTRAICASGHSSITALASKKRGDRSAAWRIRIPSLPLLSERRASQRSSSAISRPGPRFSWGRASANLSVSELLAPARSGRRRSPEAVPGARLRAAPAGAAPDPAPSTPAGRAPRGSRRAYRNPARRAGDKFRKKFSHWNRL